MDDSACLCDERGGTKNDHRFVLNMIDVLLERMEFLLKMTSSVLKRWILQVENGFLNLFVGMFLVLVTVTKEFIECMTSNFTVYVPPSATVEPVTRMALAVPSFAARIGQYSMEES